MDNNIPDTGHIPSQRIYPKKDKDRAAQKENLETKHPSDQIALSEEAKAKAAEAKKVGEWVDMLKNLPDDEDRIERGKDALKKLRENPNEMIRHTAENMNSEWATD